MFLNSMHIIIFGIAPTLSRCMLHHLSEFMISLWLTGQFIGLKMFISFTLYLIANREKMPIRHSHILSFGIQYEITYPI